MRCHPLQLFQALAGEPGSLCALAGTPERSTAPAGLMGTREQSVLSADPFVWLEIRRDRSARLLFRGGGHEALPPGEPGAILDQTIERFRLPDAATGVPGCALAISYEAGPWFAPVALCERAGQSADDVLLLAAFYENVITAGDAARVQPTGFAGGQAQAARHGEWLAGFLQSQPDPGVPGIGAAGALSSSLGHSDYLEALARVQEFIAAGDIYQVNLAQQLRLPLAGRTPAALWRHLAQSHPTGWSTWLDMGEAGILLSNSPECFLRRRGETLETFPIKGTRSTQGAGPDVVSELQRDPKELAEHRMIIDLERSDLGRIAQIGTVEVPAREYVETYGTLHHLVSCVRARVSRDLSLGAILRATFPGGSITGAPKKRAMEIIDALEPVGRGFYTGTLGTVSANGDLDLSILIRAAHFDGHALHYSAGGGIVADSRPQAEVDESWLKARAFLRACGIEEEHA